MDELIDILDANGQFSGKTALKSEAHKNGWFHKSVHIWLYTLDGKLLLQLRGKNKETFPLYWDVSVAGHIGAGESSISAAIREVSEEIGLQLLANNLTYLDTFFTSHTHSENCIDNEFHDVFIAQLNTPLTKLIKQESEVDDLALASINLLDTAHKKSTIKMVPYSKTYLTTVKEAITPLLRSYKKE